MTEEQPPAAAAPPVQPAAPQITLAQPGQLTVKVRERAADVFYVFRVELDTLRNNFTSPFSVFLGIAFGVMVTLAVAIFSGTDLGASRPYFVIGMAAFGLLTVLLLIGYVVDLIRAFK